MEFIQPRGELRRYVRYFWVAEEREPFSLLTFPIGCPQMIFHRGTPLYIPELDTYQSRFTLSGQVNFPAHISSEGSLEIIVAVFYPHTMGMFIDTPPSAFYNLEISGHDIGNHSLNELAERMTDCEKPRECIALLENWLLLKLNPSLNTLRMEHALSKLLRDPSLSVSQLATEACLGTRQFERVFRETVGMNPKEYSRIVRFQKALWMMQLGGNNYAAIAAESGYSDQSHMIRDFQLYSGKTPTSLRMVATPYSDLYTHPV